MATIEARKLIAVHYVRMTSDLHTTAEKKQFNKESVDSMVEIRTLLESQEVIDHFFSAMQCIGEMAIENNDELFSDLQSKYYKSRSAFDSKTNWVKKT